MLNIGASKDVSILPFRSMLDYYHYFFPGNFSVFGNFFFLKQEEWFCSGFVLCFLCGQFKSSRNRKEKIKNKVRKRAEKRRVLGNEIKVVQTVKKRERISYKWPNMTNKFVKAPNEISAIQTLTNKKSRWRKKVKRKKGRRNIQNKSEDESKIK